jgi:ribonuclease VapC
VKIGNEVVLDGSALLALMRAETGAERVAAVIDHAVTGAVNLAEVTSKLVWGDIAIGVVRDWIDALELDVRPLDRELACAAGALLPGTPNRGLSFGDRACLALAGAGHGADHGSNLARRRCRSRH